MQERFLETPLKNVAAHIDVGYGFGLRKELRIKTWKKKVVRNFGRINEHFLGENGNRFSETPLKSRQKISEKICPPRSSGSASFALTIVWAPLLIFW